MIHSPGNRPLDWFCSTILLRQRTGPNSLQNGSLNWPATQIARLQNSVPERNQTCPLIGRQFLINSSQSEPMIPGPIIKNLREKDRSETSWKIALSCQQNFRKVADYQVSLGVHEPSSPLIIWNIRFASIAHRKYSGIQWISLILSSADKALRWPVTPASSSPEGKAVPLAQLSRCFWSPWEYIPPRNCQTFLGYIILICIPEQFWMRCVSNTLTGGCLVSLEHKESLCILSDPVLVAQSCPTLRPNGLAHQSFLSVGFSRQEYWSGLPFPSPGDLPDPGIKLRISCIAGRFLTV